MLLKRFLQDKFKSVQDKVDMNEHFFALMMGMVGNVYYVHGSDGSDSYSGEDKDHPLLTITAALAKCTADNNDYIIILDYYQATGETWPIAVNKSRVHIMGVSGKGCPWPWVQPTGSTAAFNFTTGSGYSEICGLELGAGSASGCIEVTTSGLWGLHIHDCHLGSETIGMSALYGIQTPAGELIQGLIENCKFGGALTSDGIRINANAGPNAVRGCVIRNNIFRPDGIGINVLDVSAAFNEGGIFDNRFVMSSDANGKGVTFASGAVGLVDGNVGVMEDGAAPTNNPFSDGGTGMGWGINYQGGTALLAGPA